MKFKLAINSTTFDVSIVMMITTLDQLLTNIFNHRYKIIKYSNQLRNESLTLTDAIEDDDREVESIT